MCLDRVEVALVAVCSKGSCESHHRNAKKSKTFADQNEPKRAKIRPNQYHQSIQHQKLVIEHVFHAGRCLRVSRSWEGREVCKNVVLAKKLQFSEGKVSKTTRRHQFHKSRANNPQPISSDYLGPGGRFEVHIVRVGCSYP